MIRITTNGAYTLESDSADTYHELGASTVGSASCKALVRMKRQANSAWEQVTNQPVDTAVVAAGILLGTMFELELTVSEFTGTGYIEVELISREVGNPDNMARSRVNAQSIARIYPAGVSLVTPGRSRLNYQSIQNRDNQAIYFWHGLYLLILLRLRTCRSTQQLGQLGKRLQRQHSCRPTEKSRPRCYLFSASGANWSSV